MNWLIVILVAVLLLIIFKKEIEHKTTKIVVVLLIFFIVSIFLSYGTIKKQDLDLTTSKGIIAAGSIYLDWMGQAFVNAKSITAYATKMDWTPDSKNTTSRLSK